MPQPSRQLDLLFLTERPFWPLDQGFKVHGYHAALAARSRGASVAIASLEPPDADAPAELRQISVAWPAPSAGGIDAFRAGWGLSPGSGSPRSPMAWLRSRIASHQGLDPQRLAGAIDIVRELRPRAVVAVGMHGAAILRGLRGLCGPGGQASTHGPALVWYAADELIYFNLSCLRRESPRDWPARMRTLALHGALEAAFAPGLDAAIAVSPRDATLLRAIAGVRESLHLPNGVDLARFTPSDRTPDPQTLAFWGRLDFEPNADAVTWFAHQVWPELVRRHPAARWRIAGKNPSPHVRALAGQPGIELLGEVPDVRPVARAAALTVLPMRCGGGIKNKLLEAAAMARPILASSCAVAGLDLPAHPPALRVCGSRAAWIDAVESLWAQPAQAQQLGAAARAWVEQRHTWDAVARGLLDWLDARQGARADRAGSPASAPCDRPPNAIAPPASGRRAA